MAEPAGRLAGRIALVTGASRGLGAAVGRLFAREGAQVILVARTVGGLEEVDDKIRSEGRSATLVPIDLMDRAKIDQMAGALRERFGRLDVLVANAGVLRDKSFSKVDMPDFEFVVDVHLMGTVKCAKAVWEIMKEQNYGRIVVTTSSTGLYGNFGQTNYGAAKLAIIGFMNTLKLEGQKNNIHVNAISPVAATRMTENIMPPDMQKRLAPEYVTPGVVFLCSEEAPTGAILTAGAGAFALARLYETEGVYLGEGGLSVEEVRDNWAKITDPTGQQAYVSGGEQTQKFFRKMSGG